VLVGGIQHFRSGMCAGTCLFVERPAYNSVLQGLADKDGKVCVGNGSTPKVHVGPIISERQLERVIGFIKSGYEAGAQVAAGGQRVGGELSQGYFLALPFLSTRTTTWRS